MFEASESLQNMEGMKKIKSMSFYQYSWNSEVESTWISLIGWHHKISSAYSFMLKYSKITVCVMHCVRFLQILFVIFEDFDNGQIFYTLSFALNICTVPFTGCPIQTAKRKLLFQMFWFYSGTFQILQLVWSKNLEEKDGQTHLLCYVSLIRACNKVLYQLVYIGKKVCIP